MLCDADGKEKLRTAEKGGMLKLKGETDHPDRNRIISQILDKIAVESSSDKIQHELTMLNNIHQCTREKMKEQRVSKADLTRKLPNMYTNGVTITHPMTNNGPRSCCKMLILHAHAKLHPITAQYLQLHAQKTKKTDNTSHSGHITTRPNTSICTRRHNHGREYTFNRTEKHWRSDTRDQIGSKRTNERRSTDPHVLKSRICSKSGQSDY